MRQVGAWALGRGMCAREGHVRQGGALRQGGACSEVGHSRGDGQVRAKSDMCA